MYGIWQDNGVTYMLYYLLTDSFDTTSDESESDDEMSDETRRIKYADKTVKDDKRMSEEKRAMAKKLQSTFVKYEAAFSDDSDENDYETKRNFGSQSYEQTKEEKAAKLAAINAKWRKEIRKHQ